MSFIQAQLFNLAKDFFTGEYADTVGTVLPYAVGAFLLVLATPWIAMTLYGLYYGIFQRSGEMRSMALSPFFTFFFFLTDPATPGFDQRFLRLFHPSLLEEKKDGGSVQRGLLRAMSRCLIDNFGTVVDIPLDTVVMKKDGLDVNCVALVDFEKAKQVRCQLSWKRRPSVVKKYKQADGRYPQRRGKEATMLKGIGIAFPYTFQVTSFHVDPKRGEEFNILKYIDLRDFEDFGALFVERLFQQPPLKAVSMMVPQLQEKYAEDKVGVLEANVQKVVDACGGLAFSSDSLDIDQTSCVAVCATPSDADKAEPLPGEPQSAKEKDADKSLKAIDGVDMEYQVKCIVRHMEVYVRLTFSGVTAMVSRYELRVLADARAQVIVDRDTGSTSVVG